MKRAEAAVAAVQPRLDRDATRVPLTNFTKIGSGNLPQKQLKVGDNGYDRMLIVAQMRPALVQYFKRKCRNVDEAEDLAQDVLTRALQHAHWESAEQAQGYVFRAAVNRWRDRGRMMLTHGMTLEWHDDARVKELSEEITPEHVLSAEQELNRVAVALQELDSRTQDILILIRLERMKYAEVAAMLGVSVSTVEKGLIKALAHLASRASRKD